VNDNFTERDLGHRGFQRSGGGPFAWNHKAPVPGLVHCAKPCAAQKFRLASKLTDRMGKPANCTKFISTAVSSPTITGGCPYQ
jgi:hypothetical protein